MKFNQVYKMIFDYCLGNMDKTLIIIHVLNKKIKQKDITLI